jgi:hypothetical protein
MAREPRKKSAVNKKKTNSSGRAAAKRALIANQKADNIFKARHKYENLFSDVERLIDRCGGCFTLVTDPATEDDDGLFEPEELALIPTRQIYNGQTILEEAMEALEILIQQNERALAAREE